MPEAHGESWHSVEQALRSGLRGLPGGSTVNQLLVEHRGIRNRNHPPKLKIVEMPNWADVFRQRICRLPTAHSGEIKEAPG